MGFDFEVVLEHYQHKAVVFNIVYRFLSSDRLKNVDFWWTNVARVAGH